MKRGSIVLGLLAVAALAVAQQPAPGSQKPSDGAPGAAQQGAAAPAPPQGKRPPQAKTQPEFDAYNAVASQKDPAAVEKAADDFAAKYPDSELRALLYKSSMR